MQATVLSLPTRCRTAVAIAGRSVPAARPVRPLASGLRRRVAAVSSLRVRAGSNDTPLLADDGPAGDDPWETVEEFNTVVGAGKAARCVLRRLHRRFPTRDRFRLAPVQLLQPCDLHPMRSGARGRGGGRD